MAGLANAFDVMGPPSFQLARYPGAGARYVRHADASHSSPARSITAIYYLNPGTLLPPSAPICATVKQVLTLLSSMLIRNVHEVLSIAQMDVTNPTATPATLAAMP